MVYEVEVERGRRDPLPWWVGYFYAADRAHCPPWDLVDEPTPREWWAQAAGILAGAEGDARETIERRNRGKGRR